MLVLSRKNNQQVFIGDDIKITVLGVKGRAVRLGIEAPRSCRILRGELADQPVPLGQPAPLPAAPAIKDITVVYCDDNRPRGRGPTRLQLLVDEVSELAAQRLREPIDAKESDDSRAQAARDHAVRSETRAEH